MEPKDNIVEPKKIQNLNKLSIVTIDYFFLKGILQIN